MNGILKKTGKLLGIFFLTAFLCSGMLFLVNCIPQKQIKQNIEKSAEYYQERDLFPRLRENYANTQIDHYADCILFQIIYFEDSRNPLQSMIRSSYYNKMEQNVNDSFTEAVSKEVTPNIDYFRYWHGSIVVLKPLLCFFSASQIKWILFGILCVLLLWLTTLLILEKAYGETIALWIGLLAVRFYMAAFSIEYITTFFVMAIISIAAVRNRQKKEKLDAIFLISGILTSFVDFLTTETITFTIPLILLFMFAYREKRLSDTKTEFVLMLRRTILWGVGYAGMFLLKWILSAVCLGGAALKEAAESAGYRISGSIPANGVIVVGNPEMNESVGFVERLSGDIWKNLSCLFGFSDDSNAAAAFLMALLCIIVVISVIYLFRKKNIPWNLCGLLLCTGAIPYVRYLALSNHAYIHFFFTYRAQLATVMVFVLIVFVSVEWKKRGRNGK